MNLLVVPFALVVVGSLISFQVQEPLQDCNARRPFDIPAIIPLNESVPPLRPVLALEEPQRLAHGASIRFVPVRRA